MIEKTRGIILHQIKYTDSGIIAQLYTRKFGRQSFLIRGMRNRKSGKHNILFQPMFILDLEISYKESREMNVLKEFSVSYSPYDIYSDIRKSSVAIFLGEVLTSVLREESSHEELFDYIEKSIIYFDRSSGSFANFHIAFLAGLSSYLGFEPGTRDDPDDSFFDMTNGIFVPLPPVHGIYANPEISEILSQVFLASYDSIKDIVLTGSLRNEVLDTLIRYYSLHLSGLKKINSLAVLKEVFS
ncbi:MAG: DNA repair protein RecO [Bacteroidales bacterium]|nr:DNA repair protein RecO [Bacteroidales bacterium]